MKKYGKIIAALLSVSLTAGSIAQNIGAVEWFEPDFELRKAGVRGDADYDGRLTGADVEKFQSHFLNTGNFVTDEYIYDVNSDGQKNILDFITLKSAVLGETKVWSYKNLPLMDGSTSAIPLEAGFKAKLLGMPYYAVKNTVKHHKTHESFQMLLSGDIDMIFTVPISESQQKAADEAGVHLNQVPVAKEGFVFVVNKDNPVDSLTQQQIKDIYSGKITNWSEVGGNDEPIIPYQRNNDSGSQNYMVEFMKDSGLVNPPSSYRILSMGGLMDAVAVYDNSSQAIGYSVYSYAAQMYENSSSVKFIAVDGVRPSRETMADDTYPLLSSTYIMYTDDVSKDTLDFTEWAVSDEGQQCVLENGYIPVSKIEYPDRLKPFKGIGTGKEKPADYTPDKKYTVYFDSYTGYDTAKYRLKCLKDKNLEESINSDISKAFEKIPKADRLYMSAVNGYMCITISKGKNYYYPSDDFWGVDSYSDVITLNYDLRTGKKIENLSDYFYKGVDFTENINSKIASDMNGRYAFLAKSDFIGLTGGIENFTYDKIYTGNESYFVDDNIDFDFSSYYLTDLMVTGEYFDMREIFEDPEKVEESSYEEWNYKYVPADGESNFIYTLEGSRFHTEEEISEKKKIYDKITSYMQEKLKGTDLSYETYLILEPGEYINTIGMGRDDVFVCYKKFDSLMMLPYKIEYFMFDPESGEYIDTDYIAYGT